MRSDATRSTVPESVEAGPGSRPGEPPRRSRAPGLPGYEHQLSSFHRAFERELRAIVACLPLRRGMRVLDLACGDGFYTKCMAERLGPGGLVVGADSSLAYLDACRAIGSGGPSQPGSGLVGSQFDLLPFPDGTFDLVWCAQSLYSLPDAVAAVASMARVLRPGGQVAVLENDTLHHVILPWPVALELPLRTAELQAFQAEGRSREGFEVGRRLPAILAAAGLEPLHLTTHAFDRQAPLALPERELLQCYLEDLLRRVAPHVDPALLGELQLLADPGSATFLPRLPNLSMTWLCVLAMGRKGRPSVDLPGHEIPADQGGVAQVHRERYGREDALCHRGREDVGPGREIAEGEVADVVGDRRGRGATRAGQAHGDRLHRRGQVGQRDLPVDAVGRHVDDTEASLPTLGEPDVAVGPGGDALGPGASGRERELLGEPTAVRVGARIEAREWEARDGVPGLLGHVERLVRAEGDPGQVAAGHRRREP